MSDETVAQSRMPIRPFGRTLAQLEQVDRLAENFAEVGTVDLIDVEQVVL
jgi:hypothetical protein